MSKDKFIPEKERLKDILDNAWLNIDDVLLSVVKNPFDTPKTEEDIENPHIYFLKLIRNPENFFFTCKHIFNVELLPFQLCILQELWNRKYPMLVASRGGGKSFLLALYAMLRAFLHQGSKIVIVGAAFRQAKVVFEYCESIWNNAPLLRDLVGTGPRSGPKRDIDRCTCMIGESSIIALPLGDGTKIRGQRANYIIADEFACLDANTLVETDNGLIRISDCKDRDINCINKNGFFEKPSNFIITPKTDVYEITTLGGYNFKCSGQHKVMTMNGWKLAKDLKQNDYLVFDNKYIFPSKYLHDDTAWLLGILLSEGSVNHPSQIQVTNTDKSVIERIQNILGGTFNYRESYIDDRGWNYKASYRYSIYDKKSRDYFYELGLEYNTAITKKIPFSILESNRRTVLRFLSGLFDGDGSCFLWKDRNIKNRIGIAYYSVSKQLIDELHILLKKLGYFSTIQTRESKISDNLQYIIRLNGKHAYDFGKELNINKWSITLEQCFEKDVINDNLRIVFDKSRNKWKVDITLCGSNKYIGRFNSYDEAKQKAIDNLPIEHIQVKSVCKLNYQDNLYDFYLPQTNSFYANCFIQHNSIPEEIYENVVSGFAAVSASPVEQVKNRARLAKLREYGLIGAEDNNNSLFMGNQAILSGTAYYDFNHFSKYWKTYKKIIESKGNRARLEEVFQGEVPENFNYKDYCVIRIPVQVLPPGFMDEKHVARSKATVHSGIFNMEFGACFTTDSNGFYKRSLIESCVTKGDGILLADGQNVQFEAVIRGNPRGKYVYGVDPASEQDNFSIVVLEIHPNHRRVVYCWTTTKASHRERVKAGLVRDQDFYGYCARQIRNLMKVFPTDAFGMDAQGGGIAVEEALHDIDKLQPGELPIWRAIEEDNEQLTDGYHGLHILHMIQFADAAWTREANHGMRKDFEDRVLLFPLFDALSVNFANEEDIKHGRLIDTKEECVFEIEELKDELATIVHSQTGVTGRDKWDTPEVKMPGGKKGRLRKDRYSALVIANMIARTLQRAPEPLNYKPVGGFAAKVGKYDGGKMYNAPAWFEEAATGLYGRAIHRG